MTRKRISQGLFEAFTEQCPECNGRGVKVVREFPTGGKQKGGAPTPAQLAKRTPKADKAESNGAADAQPDEATVPEPTAPESAAADEPAPDFEDLTPPEWRFAAAPAE